MWTVTPPGGDGSQDSPLNDLSEAIAQPGDIVLRAGRYRWPVEPLGARTIQATCPEYVTVAGTLHISEGDELRVDRVTLDAEDAEAAVVVDGGALSLNGVVVLGGTEAALDLRGGQAWMRGGHLLPGRGIGARVTGGDHRIADTRVEARAAAGALVSAGALSLWNVAFVDCDGLRIDGGHLGLLEVQVLRPLGVGLHARGGALVGATGLTLLDTRPLDGTTGVLIEEGATFDAAFSRLVRAGAQGIVARGESTRLVLSLEIQVVHGLTGGGAQEGAIRIEQGAQAEIALTEIFGAAQTGLAVIGPGSAATIDRVRIEQVLPETPDTAAIRVQDGARLVGRALSYHGTLQVDGAEVAVENVHGISDFDTVRVDAEGHVTLTDADLDVTDGFALVSHGGVIEGTRIQLVAPSTTLRPVVYAEAGTLRLTDARIEGGGGLRTGAFTELTRTSIMGADQGLSIAPAGRVWVEDGFFLENRGLQIEVAENGVLDAHRVRIAHGPGIHVRPGARATFEEARLYDLLDFGLQADGPELTLSRTRVEGVRQDQARAPVGLSLTAGAHAVLTQVHLTDNEHTGLVCTGARLEATDLTVHDTPGTDLGTSGRGLVFEAGCRATLTRTWLARNRASGLTAAGSETEVEATDLLIQDTLPDDTERAVSLLALGSRVTLQGALIEGGQHIGLTAGEGARITAERLWIRNTVPSYLQADGLVLQGGSTFVGRHVLLTDHPGTAALVERATLVLDDALIARSGIGLAVGPESIVQLDGVIFLDNIRAR